MLSSPNSHTVNFSQPLDNTKPTRETGAARRLIPFKRACSPFPTSTGVEAHTALEIWQSLHFCNRPAIVVQEVFQKNDLVHGQCTFPPAGWPFKQCFPYEALKPWITNSCVFYFNGHDIDELLLANASNGWCAKANASQSVAISAARCRKQRMGENNRTNKGDPSLPPIGPKRHV